MIDFIDCFCFLVLLVVDYVPFELMGCVRNGCSSCGSGGELNW